jgi:hypothetical protein
LTARTSKSWPPCSSGPATNGEVHGTNGEPSTEHWNVAPAWFVVNVNVAL